MKVKTQYNRRSFLKVSAATGGGMVLGFSWLASCNPTAEQMKSMPSEWFDINAYLKIGDNGLVTIFSPNPEIGQNVKTSMPMIVAEELDVDWKDVVVEQRGLNTNWYSRQVAGGSASISSTWDSLRMAGASAKQMLVAAAAAQWEVKPEECTVADGVIQNANGDKLTFGEVASAAAQLPVPTTIILKEAKDYKIIGKGKGNVDIDKIITGKPLFGIDTKREGMKYATVVRPPFYAKKIKSFDDSVTRKVNGVIDVFKISIPRKEGFDLEKIAIVANSTWAAIKGQKALIVEWDEDSKPETSEDHEAELDALLNKSKGKNRRSDGDVKKAFAEADEVFEKTYHSPYLPHNCMEPMNFFAHVDADGKVEATGPIQTPEWTKNRIIDMLELAPKMDWQADEATQNDIQARRDTAPVAIGMTRMGGGFGRRLYGDFTLEAVQVSKISKSPIQLVWTREDDMEGGTYRPSIKYRIKAAIKDNKITGYQLTEACMSANMYGRLPNNFPAGAISNYEVVNHQGKSNITVGAWRAPYTNFLASAEQSFFDEIAEKLNVDAVQLRLDILADAKKLYDQHDAIDKKLGADKKGIEAKIAEFQYLIKSPNQPKEDIATWKDEIKTQEEQLKAIGEQIAEATKGLAPKGNYEPDRFIEVIKLAKEKSGWGNPTEGEYLGFSVYFSHSTYVAEVAHVVIENNKPKIKKVTCVVDCGLVVNPKAAINLVQGGVIDGIGHAMYSDFRFENGKPYANNFDKYRLIRMREAPQVEVHFVDNGIRPTGLGEPTLPPAGGAVANAIYSATKERLYRQPYILSKKIQG